jgi:HK97 family phage portal protein
MDSALARLWGGANVQTSAGLGVSEDSALNIAAFWRGVQLLSGQIAALPLHLYKSGKNGAQERYDNSKLYKLLHDSPNPEMSAFSLKESMQSHLLTWGNAFAEIERNNIGQPVALWLITPDRVVFYRDLEDKQLKYRVAPSGRVIAAPDMLHIPGLGFDGLIGYSVIGRARQSLGLTVAAERYGSTFFGNGASFGGVLETPDDMDKPQRDDLRGEINTFHQGPDRAHRFLILWNGLKYSKMAMAPEEAQFLQTRKTQVLEIARWLGVPPNKLYDPEGRMAGSGIEAQGIEYYTDTMLMWFEKWEQELNRKLIPSLEQNYQYFEFDFSGVMRADTQARFTAYNMGKQGGWLSSDDIRAFENMSPLENGAGDFYLAPLNMIPADKFREYIDRARPDPTDIPPAPTPIAGDGGATKDPQEAVDAALRRALSTTRV